MDLGERVRELSYSVPSGITDRLNFEWTSKILSEGFIGCAIPNNLKIRYLSESRDLGEMQKRSEVWQFLFALCSAFGAGRFGLNFSNVNPFAQIAVRFGSAGVIGYNALGIVGIPYRLLSHHDRGQRLSSIPFIHKPFRFIGDYDEKPFPASMFIEGAYKLFIEKILDEKRLFSFLDSVQEFYYSKLPTLALPY